MATDVESISPVGLGSGDAADPVSRFDHHRHPVGVESLEVQRTGEARRTSSDHQGVNEFIRSPVGDHFLPSFMRWASVVFDEHR